VLLRDQLDDLVDADLLIGLLGVSAVLTGLLRVLGSFAAERQFGRRWTIGGLVLEALEIVLGGDCCSRPESMPMYCSRSRRPGDSPVQPASP
jgi:hypothetical protein